MLWFKVPDVAVTVAVYVPDGVPCVVVEVEFPPHDISAPKTSMRIGATQARATKVSRRRFSIISPPRPMISIHGIIVQGSRKSGNERLAFEELVVFTETVTVWVPLPVRFTAALDKLHVAAGVATGVIEQLKSTVPLNAPDGASSRLKLAVCPALIVWEVGEPGDGLKTKSGGA